jgi:hypothetical protein
MNYLSQLNRGEKNMSELCHPLISNPFLLGNINNINITILLHTINIVNLLLLINTITVLLLI